MSEARRNRRRKEQKFKKIMKTQYFTSADITADDVYQFLVNQHRVVPHTITTEPVEEDKVKVSNKDGVGMILDKEGYEVFQKHSKYGFEEVSQEEVEKVKEVVNEQIETIKEDVQ